MVKDYSSYSVEHSKRDAVKTAKDLRERGYGARVIPGMTHKGRTIGWEVLRSDRKLKYMGAGRSEYGRRHAHLNVRPSGVPIPRFDVDDMVYSWQNPTVRRSVTKIQESREPGYQHKYKVSLRDQDGYSYSSKWMNESSLSRRRR